jgi:hypothetical protein
MSRQRPPQLWAGQPTLMTDDEGPWTEVGFSVIGLLLEKKKLIPFSLRDMSQ